MGKYGKGKQATDIIQRMRALYWMTRSTDTHSEYVISLALALEQWLRESTLTL